MAKEVKVIFKGDPSDAVAATRMIKEAGADTAKQLIRDFQTLGVQTTLTFDEKRKAAQSAYDRIKASGLASTKELAAFEKAHAARMVQVDEEQFGKRISLLDKFKANWIGVTASIAAAWAIASKAITLAQSGATFQAQGTGFANLAASYGKSADQIVTDLQRVSNGTLSIQQTVEQSGKAMVLGVGADYLPKLLEMARASARITGGSTQKAFNDLVEGVAKGSSELLNNLGIIVRAEDAYKKYAAAHDLVATALTAEQKQQAILNEVMLKGNDIVERAGKLGESEAEKLAKFSASIDNIGKSVGILLSGPMSHLAGEMSATVGWFEAYQRGQITFWEYAFTGATEAAEKLKGMKTTNFDASVTEEGKALARKKIEETARAVAESAAKIKKEATAKALVEANTAREKELAAILKHNDRILEVEKKRIDKLLELETTNLQKITAAYEAADKARDDLVAARAAVKSQFTDAKNAVNPSAGQSDPYLQRLTDLDNLGKKEEEIDNDWNLSAEEKAKKLAALATEAATYNTAVILDGYEVISQLDAQATGLEIISRLERESAQALATESVKQEDAFNKSGAAMLAAEDKAKAFKSEIEDISTLLDLMNNKEIVVPFKVTGAEQLLAILRMSSAENYVRDESDPNFIGPTQSSGFPTTSINTRFGSGFGEEADPSTPWSHAGTGYVAKSGLRYVARGEQILNRNEATAARSGSQIITIAPVIQISGVSARGADKTARELAREIEPELRKLASRYR